MITEYITEVTDANYFLERTVLGDAAAVAVDWLLLGVPCCRRYPRRVSIIIAFSAWYFPLFLHQIHSIGRVAAELRPFRCEDNVIRIGGSFAQGERGNFSAATLGGAP